MIPETDDAPTTTQIEGYVFKPAPATAENVNQLRVPAGFKVSIFAEDLSKPRMLVASSAGHG